MPKYFDVHTHIQFAAFAGDSKEVIERALAEDIWILNVGTQKDTSLNAVEIAGNYDKGVYATVGLHPIHTERSYHDEKELGGEDGFMSRGEDFDHSYYKNLGKRAKVVAIGECGLDYYRLAEETKNNQRKVFEEQIQLSRELEKPLMIHCRGGFRDLIEILQSNKDNLGNPAGLVHFFTGTKDDAATLLKLGFSFSFGGVITFARDYDEALNFIPLQNLLLETDAPYVAPAPYRGKRNEPLYVIEVAKKIAEFKGVSLEKVGNITTANALKLFKI